MTVQKAALKILAKYKGMEIIEALPGNDKFIFCLKPRDYDGIVLDSYYYIDNKGNIGEYPVGLHMEEWQNGMKHKFDLKELY